MIPVKLDGQWSAAVLLVLCDEGDATAVKTPQDLLCHDHVLRSEHNVS
jgi:hypothetical protein